MSSRPEHNQKPPTDTTNRHCAFIPTRRKIAVLPQGAQFTAPLARGRSSGWCQQTPAIAAVTWVMHNSVALTWSSVVGGRPDRPSRGRRRIVPGVCKECSSKSTHFSKVHGSYQPPRAIGPGSFTRRPVWTRRASHPAPSGRPPRGGEKVAWFRYSFDHLGCSREDPGRLIIGRNEMKEMKEIKDRTTRKWRI